MSNGEYETKKTSPLVWVGLGCGGCLGVIVLLLVIGGIIVHRYVRHFHGVMVEFVENKKGVMEAQQILLAFHNYHDTTRAFPPAYTVDAEGKPLHSWRVQILPFIEEQELYNKIRHDEPWDSEYNSQFHSQMPAIFRGAFDSSPASTGMTNYVWVVGENTVGNGSSGISLSRMSDGTSNTAVLFETRRPICWMAPEDLTLDDLDKGISEDENDVEAGINSHVLSNGNRVSIVGFGDGSVMLMRSDVPVDVLRALVIMNDGKSVSASDYATNPDEEMEKAMREVFPIQR